MYVGTTSVAASTDDLITIHGVTKALSEHATDGTVRVVSQSAGKVEYVVALSGD